MSTTTTTEILNEIEQELSAKEQEIALPPEAVWSDWPLDEDQEWEGRTYVRMADGVHLVIDSSIFDDEARDKSIEP